MKEMVLIPAYKPDDTLIALVKELICESFSVVVVNDGSPKEYHKVFFRVSELCEVIHLEKKTAVRALLSRQE